ncbi:MAG: hypothetical protein QXO12_01630 [Candidatus Pacearchaeota archaeon]
MKIITKKEKKRILNFLKIYGFNKKDFSNYLFFRNGDKINIITKDKEKIIKNFQDITNVLGFYLGKIEKNGIRLSFDACQLFKEKIKNFIEIDENQANKWFKGEDIEIKKDINGFFILKFNNDLIGCGYAKNGKMKNYVPKERRIK